MAAELSPAPARAARLRVPLLVLATALLLVVGLARPNAAQPDLDPHGWAPGTLLPLTLTPAVVTGLLWAAYALAAAGVWLGMRRAVAPLRTWWLPAGVGAVSLLVAPFGSADHVSYLAYGRILVTGGDPWLVSPDRWAGGTDPVVSRVEPPWTEEPSIYGPVGTLLHGLSALVGGTNLRQGVWAWQLLVVLAWLGVRLALRLALPERAHGRVDVLWTLNPLVLGVGVLGAHVDVVATAFVVAAVAVAHRRPGWRGAVAAGALAGLAASTKVTYGIVLVALVGAWWLAARVSDEGLPRHGDAHPHRLLPRVGALLAGFLVIALPLHLWAGPHVFDQLLRSRQAVSLATPWRLALDHLGPVLGTGVVRGGIGVGAALLAVALAVGLARLTRSVPVDNAAGDAAPTTPAPPHPVGPTALWLTAVLALAYSLAAPYSLPWYDVLAWAGLPAVLPGLVDAVALARLTVMAWAYVPGRVLGMTPGVEEVTLGVRRGVAPWLALGLWVAVGVAAARRGSGPARGPRRAGGSATPTR